MGNTAADACDKIIDFFKRRRLCKIDAFYWLLFNRRAESSNSYPILAMMVRYKMTVASLPPLKLTNKSLYLNQIIQYSWVFMYCLRKSTLALTKLYSGCYNIPNICLRCYAPCSGLKYSSLMLFIIIKKDFSNNHKISTESLSGKWMEKMKKSFELKKNL